MHHPIIKRTFHRSVTTGVENVLVIDVHEGGLVLKLRRVRVFWTGDRLVNIRGWGKYQGSESLGG